MAKIGSQVKSMGKFVFLFSGSILSVTAIQQARQTAHAADTVPTTAVTPTSTKTATPAANAPATAKAAPTAAAPAQASPTSAPATAVPTAAPATAVPTAGNTNPYVASDQITWQAGSVQPGNDAANVGDKDPSTLWHSSWNGTDVAHNYIQADLKQATTLNGLTYMPRQNGTNGIAIAYNIQVSDDGQTWTTIKSGQLAANASIKVIDFDKPVTTMHVRFQITAAVNDNPSSKLLFGSAAEMFLNLQTSAQATYKPDFNQQQTGWQANPSLGKPTVTTANNTVTVTNNDSKNPNSVTYDTNAPSQTDGEFQVAFTTPKTNPTQIGFLFRANGTKWSGVEYDEKGSWVLESSDHGYKTFSGPTLDANQQYVLKVQYIGNWLNIFLNGQSFFTGTSANIGLDAGYFGIRSWKTAKTLTINSLQVGELGSIPDLPNPPVSTAPSDSYTRAGNQPILSPTVQVNYTYGPAQSAPVVWDSIDPSLWGTDKVGTTFEVNGTVTINGQTLAAKTTVHVLDPNVELEQGTDITAGEMTARLDPNHLRIIGYTNQKTGKHMLASTTINDSVVINGKTYTPTISSKQDGQSKMIYTLTFANFPDLSFDIAFTVTSDNQLQIKMQNVQDPKNQLNSISLPGLQLVSVNAMDQGAQFAGATVYLATNAYANKNGDTITDLTKDSTIDANAKGYAYGFLSNADTSVAVYTTSADDLRSGGTKYDRLYKQTVTTDQGRVTVLTSGEFTYRPSAVSEFGGSFTAPDGHDALDPMPAITVKLTSDQNGDGVVDWQDGALAYRSIAPTPIGADQIKNLVVDRIPFNFASEATNPFTKTLDETKRIYNSTDGLGQDVLLKGYANEGHDSGHPDYFAVGERIGGVDALKAMIAEAHKYGGKIGVHINATEAYPEAKSFNDGKDGSTPLVNTSRKGWAWLDQAYLIQEREDAISGDRLDRIAELKALVPDLDFIYVDVWGQQGESGAENKRLAEEIQSNGWWVQSEFPQAMEGDSLMSHWAVDINYGGDSTKGINSNIIRFMFNDERDTWISKNNENPLLGGAQLQAYEGWAGASSYDQMITQTFSENLPTKFLQHFQIQNWQTTMDAAGKNNGTIKFTGNVVSTNDNATQTHQILQDGRVVLNGDAYLLPWWSADGKTADSKLYHFNAKGGSTTWTLPDSWTNESKVVLYKLTDQGRVAVGTLDVTNHQVTIDADANQAYVVTKVGDTFAPATDFGAGTGIKDPGFNEKDTIAKNWQVDHGQPTITRNTNGDYELNTGNTALEMSQNVTLAAGQYSAMIQVSSQNRPGQLIVQQGGKTYVGTVVDSVAQNYIRGDAHHTVGNGATETSYMQILRVDFTVTGTGQTKLILAAADGKGDLLWDNMRIVPRLTTPTKDEVATEIPGTTSHGRLVYSQDFEDTSATGLAPFVMGSADGVNDPRTHLSENHAPYTDKEWKVGKESSDTFQLDDTIDGNWSLKSYEESDGLLIQTLPQTIGFQAGGKYQIVFNYEADAGNAFTPFFAHGEFDPNKVDQPFAPLNKSNDKASVFSATIDVPADVKNGWFGLYKTAGNSVGTVVLDNFKVYRLTDAPTVQASNIVVDQNAAKPDYLGALTALGTDGQETAKTGLTVDSSKADLSTPGVYTATYTGTVDGQPQTGTFLVTVLATTNQNPGNPSEPGTGTETPGNGEELTNTIATIVQHGTPVTVYDQVNGTATNKQLAEGTDWKAFRQVKDANGNVWYNLGGNQWIKGDGVILDAKPNTYNHNRMVGVISETAGNVVYTAPGVSGKATDQVLKVGTGWQISATVMTDDGQTWYRVGTNQWIKADGVVFDNVQAFRGVGVINYVPGYGIAVWSDQNGTKFTGKHLETGSSWKLFAKAVGKNGHTFYNLGGNQWIDGANLILLPNTAANQIAKNSAKLKVAAPVWTTADQKQQVKRLAAGQQVTVIATQNTAKWLMLQIAANEWIQADLTNGIR